MGRQQGHEWKDSKGMRVWYGETARICEYGIGRQQGHESMVSGDSKGMRVWYGETART